MRYIFTVSVLLWFSIAYAQSFQHDSLLLKKAVGHPMQYYLSLPQGWNPKQQYPVVLIAEAAEKEYKENTLRFVRVRKNMPFILVAPFNVNNSRSGRRDPAIFPYSRSD